MNRAVNGSTSKSYKQLLLLEPVSVIYNGTMLVDFVFRPLYVERAYKVKRAATFCHFDGIFHLPTKLFLLTKIKKIHCIIVEWLR